MTQFEELYQEIILDHYRRPRNMTSLSHIPDEEIHENPVCGDGLKLDVRFGENGKIERILFDGHGCAVSIASASMMTQLLSGLSPNEAEGILRDFLSVLRGNTPPEELEKYGDLAALSGVVQFPMRVKCATLAWHALEKWLDRKYLKPPADPGTAE